MKQFFVAVLVVFSLGVVFAAAAGAPAPWNSAPPRDHVRPNPFAADQGAVTAGALLYRDHCQQCHGADAEGKGQKKPSLHPQNLQSATDGDLEWFLRQGDLRRGMPSWSSLPQAQRWQIIAYLRSLH